MSAKVWVVDDDEAISWVLQKALEKSGYAVRMFSNAIDAREALAHRDGTADAILTDIRMPGESGLWLAEEIRSMQADIPVIVMTAFGDLDSAVGAFKHGAFEYLTKPFDIDEMLALVAKAISDSSNITNDEARNSEPSVMLGSSPQMQDLFRVIGRLSSTNMNVLIRGESGVGKELVARAVHASSPRSSYPLVAINIAAIPSELLESELFGHEKGAFTGATSRHIGRFEQANRGTLFLDEIGDMPAALQTRLLRVLSEGRFFRVGGVDEIGVDVRVIAATNQNLEAAVSDGRFRLDLFHRLNVMSLDVPALRQRAQDIGELADHFLELAVQSSGGEKKRLSAQVIDCLEWYRWPGNVRELENLMYRMAVMAPGQRIEVSDLPNEIQQSARENAQITSSSPDSWQSTARDQIFKNLARGDVESVQRMEGEFERVLMQAALEYTGGHRRKAAEVLGWGRNTLTRKAKQLGLD
ncbi:MAG: nitrogen regulation protein NR(I) [Pseudomonadota bacterium]